MSTVYTRLMDWREKNAVKHELGDDHAERELNRLSRKEFLQEISEAIEEVIEERLMTHRLID